jgi:hypothetical protein
MDGRDRDKVPEVNQLLDKVQNVKMIGYESNAYNYLIDYCELGFFHSHEADRLLSLCIDIMKAVLEDAPNRDDRTSLVSPVAVPSRKSKPPSRSSFPENEAETKAPMSRKKRGT